METKRYTKQAKSCIKGEAFFESVISEYAIPHHVTGPKDLGIDYFCEWVYGDKPSGLLFGVQIKTVMRKSIKPNANELPRSKLRGIKRIQS